MYNNELQSILVFILSRQPHRIKGLAFTKLSCTVLYVQLFLIAFKLVYFNLCLTVIQLNSVGEHQII